MDDCRSVVGQFTRSKSVDEDPPSTSIHAFSTFKPSESRLHSYFVVVILIRQGSLQSAPSSLPKSTCCELKRTLRTTRQWKTRLLFDLCDGMRSFSFGTNLVTELQKL